MIAAKCLALKAVMGLMLLIVTTAFGPRVRAADEPATGAAAKKPAELETRSVEIYRLKEADPEALLGVLQVVAPEAKLTADPSAKTILALGTPEEHKQIEELLAKLDVPQDATPPKAAEKPDSKAAPAGPDQPAVARKKERSGVDEAGRSLVDDRATDTDMLAVGDICEVKHYDTGKSLLGYGLLFDLEEVTSRRTGRSTAGEPEQPEAMKLSEVLKMLSQATSQTGTETGIPDALMQSDQVILVEVTATVPPQGVSKDDRIDCEVRTLGEGDVANGFLLPTELFAPGPKREEPLALAAGPVAADGATRGGPRTVANGCLLLTDIEDEFIKDDKIVLVLEESHADFLTAQDVANTVNDQFSDDQNQPLAKARNRFSVEVTVPPAYAENAVHFVTQILQLRTSIPKPEEEEGTD